MTQHKNKITCFAASKLNKFVKQENLDHLFSLHCLVMIALFFLPENGKIS